MLLRFFIHFYNMEVIEEEAYMKWKEDITDEFPGKGKALFQVSSDLTKEVKRVNQVSQFDHCVNDVAEATTLPVMYGGRVIVPPDCFGMNIASNYAMHLLCEIINDIY